MAFVIVVGIVTLAVKAIVSYLLMFELPYFKFTKLCLQLYGIGKVHKMRLVYLVVDS